MTKDMLDLHCAHGKRVYERCEQCEADVAAGKGTGFTTRNGRCPVDGQHFSSMSKAACDYCNPVKS